MNKDLDETGLSGNEVHNRGNWRLLTENDNLTSSKEKGKEKDKKIFSSDLTHGFQYTI